MSFVQATICSSLAEPPDLYASSIEERELEVLTPPDTVVVVVVVVVVEVDADVPDDVTEIEVTAGVDAVMIRPVELYTTFRVRRVRKARYVVVKNFTRTSK